MIPATLETLDATREFITSFKVDIFLGSTRGGDEADDDILFNLTYGMFNLNIF